MFQNKDANDGRNFDVIPAKAGIQD